MKVVHHYYIEFDREVFDILSGNNIKVKVDDPNNAIGNTKMIFDICHEPDDLSLINRIPYSSSCSWLHFSKEEIACADWLYMYPNTPMLESRDSSTIEFLCKIQTSVGNFIQEGAYHQKQVKPFSLTPPKWTNRNHLYSAYEGDNFIFCDDFFKRLIEDNGLIGLRFAPVIWWKKNTTLPDTHQLNITNCLPHEAIVVTDMMKEFKCPFCGRQKYEFDSLFRLHLRGEFLDKSVDFYKTPEIFGTGREHYLLVVSHRVYSLMSSLKIERSWNFHPVIIH